MTGIICPRWAEFTARPIQHRQIAGCDAEIGGKAAIFRPANSRFFTFRRRSPGMFIARSGAIDD
jgi:hypothetical protein